MDLKMQNNCCHNVIQCMRSAEHSKFLSWPKTQKQLATLLSMAWHGMA